MQYQFKEETQGLNAALIYSLTPSDELDEMSLEMLVRNAIPGLVPVSSSSLDGTLSLRYNVTGMKKLSRVFSGTVSRQQLLGCLLDICDTFATTANYMLEENTLLLHPDEIYLQSQTGRVKMICLPLLNVQEQLPLHEFLKQIMFTTRFDPHEDCSHVAQIINYLNSTDSFTAQELRALVQSLLVSAPAQPQRPAPAPSVPVSPAVHSAPAHAPAAPSARPAQPAAPARTVQAPPPARPAVPVQPQPAAAEPVPAAKAPNFPTSAAAPVETPKVSSAAPAFAVPGVPGGFIPAAPQKPLTPKEQKKLEKQKQKEEKVANKEKGHFSLFGKKKEPAQPAAEAVSLPGTPAGMAIPGAGKPLYKPASPRRAKVAAEQPFSYAVSATPATKAAPVQAAAPAAPVFPAPVQAVPVTTPQAVPAAARPVMPPVGGTGFCTVTIADPNALPLIAVQDFSDGTMFPDDDNTMLQTESDATELAGTTPQAKAAWIRCRATGEASRINKCLFVLGRYGEPKHRPDGSVDYPADCTVRTQDRGISRRHAAILFYGGRFYLADISSRHETYLNGILTEHEDNAQMQAAPITFTRAYPLKNGDLIRLRSEEFQFEEG